MAGEKSPTIVDNEIPECLNWSCNQVADWVEGLGFPQYKDCFRNNFINGRRLILMEASRLPLIGVYKMEDIMELTQSIRNLLGIKKCDHEGVTAIPDAKVLFLRRKRLTGAINNRLTYGQFIKENEQFFNKFNTLY